MILPLEFEDFDKYFEEISSFLQKYSWLYEAPVTHILTSNVLSKIPQEWVNHLLALSNDELNDVPTGFIKSVFFFSEDDWPCSLIQFSRDCQRFTLPALTTNTPLYKPYDLESWRHHVPREIWRGMSPKKKDEVEIMSALVHYESKMLGIGKILDLGSGLGYIDRLLLLRGYRILGVESQPKLVSFSTMQKENFFPSNMAKDLEYHNMRIRESLLSETRNAILKGLFETPETTDVKRISCEKKSNNNVNKYDWERLIPLCRDVSSNSDKVCLIGLHACGDLTVDGLKIFLGVPEVSAMVLVPCCYHKMSLTNQTAGDSTCDTDIDTFEANFNNFPLSNKLTQASFRVGNKFVCRPFLRLANQGTNSGWSGWTATEHQCHAFHVLSRAVIELFAKQQGAVFKKCFRRVVRKASLKEKDFASYIDESLSRCEFINHQQSLTIGENKDTIRATLMERWEQHKSKMQLAEALTALQMCLEPVAESLVVSDRLSFLRERGIDNIRVVKMMNSSISPRSLAYIASKNEIYDDIH